MTNYQLLKAVLLAALFSPKSNERTTQVMLQLGNKNAAIIAGAIQDMEDLDARLAENGVDTETGSEMDIFPEQEPVPAVKGPSINRDPELEREEELIQVVQHSRRLEAQVAELTADINEKQEEVAKLQERLEEAQTELHRRNRQISDERHSEAHSKMMRDQEYIAEI